MEGMSLEVLELIQETAVKAKGSQDKLQIIDAPQLGPGVVLIVKHDGDFEIKQKIERRKHAIYDLDSIHKWTAYAIDELKALKPILFVNQETIRIVIDDGSAASPRPFVVYQFKQTREYKLLLRLGANSEPQQMNQKQFVRMLRTELWDCLDPTKRDDLVKILRSLESVSGQTGRSSVGQGRESLGREIDEVVTSQLGAIPETLTLQVRLFQDPALSARQSIVCDLDINPNTFSLSLAPINADMDEALENELNDVVKYLQTKLPKDTPVFRGMYAKD